MSLKSRIENVFNQRRDPPFPIELRNTSQPDTDQADALWFTGRSWEELSLDDWEEHSGAFFAFSPDAFIYYLPSVLTLSLDGQCRSQAADALIQKLDRMPLPIYWDDFLIQRLMGLENEVYEVLKDWILSLSDTDARRCEDALFRAYQTIDLLKSETERGKPSSAADRKS